MSAPKVSGRRFVFGFVAFLAIMVVGAITLWYVRKDPHGPILAEIALGEDSVMLRQGYEERGYVHLMRVDSDGEARWSEALYGIEADPALTVAGERILVRAREARGHAELHAFDLDGAFAWRGGRNRHESPEGNPAFTEHPLWLAESTVFYVHASDPVEVVVLDLDTGEEQGRVDFPSGEGDRSAQVEGDGLRIDPGDGTTRFVSHAGEVETR